LGSSYGVDKAIKLTLVLCNTITLHFTSLPTILCGYKTVVTMRLFIMLFTSVLCLILSGTTSAPAKENLRVVVSIAPLHSLAAGLMLDGQKPYLLARGGSSPHTYSLRPSDARALQDADLVFWVGAELESFLVKPLKNQHNRSKVIQLHKAAEVALLPSRGMDMWSNEQPHGLADDHAHDHHAGAYDMHLWLDPDNVKALIATIAQALIAADPDNRVVYQNKEKLLLARLERLDRHIASQLAKIKEVPFMVFHDGFQYFEHHYQLKAVAAITPSPEQRPGARRIQRVRQLVKKRRVHCLFQEPQFNPAIANSVVAGSKTKIGLIDPLGSSFAPGPEQYFQTMQAIANSMEQCLSTPD
jgi:zinc transport system substrate-binding protein